MEVVGLIPPEFITSALELTLLFLVLLTAKKSKCFPWPVARKGSSKQLPGSSEDIRKIPSSSVLSEAKASTYSALAYFLALGLGTIIFNLVFALGFFTINPGSCLTKLNLFTSLFTIGLSSLAPMPFFAIYQLLVFGGNLIQESDRKEMRCRYVMSLSFFMAFMMVGIPISLFFLSLTNLIFLPIGLVRCAYISGLTLSSIPISVAGIAAVVNGSLAPTIVTGGSWSAHMRNVRLLRASSFQLSQVEHCSDEDLQGFLQLAVRTKNMKAADEISQFILDRAKGDQIDHSSVEIETKESSE